MAAQVILETQRLDEAANEIRERLLGLNPERVGPFEDVRVAGHTRTWFAKWLT